MYSASRVPLEDAHLFECEDAALFAHGGKSLDTQENSPLEFYISTDFIGAV